MSHPRARLAGRVNVLLLAGIICLVLLGVVIFQGRQSVTAVGAQFMSALATHDVNRLTDLTYLDGRSKEDVRKQWDFAVNQAGKHYLFTWRITAGREVNDQKASVAMQVVRNAASGGSYEEKFDLPLQKEDGQWKVDVAAISRDMFPALPR